MSHRFPLRAIALVAALLALIPCPDQRTALARGGEAGPAQANLVLGEQLFDQCVRWVARGGRGVTRTTDFHIAVTAELDLDAARHRGPMRLWWQAPDKYRQELTTNERATTKILNGDFMWIVHPEGRVQRMHGTSEGAGAIRQVKEDRERMADLAQFITLQSLKGPGVTFEFVGEKTGTGSYAGNWVKITRRAPGAAVMHFWLAYDRDAQGAYLAKWPGIVRVDGDARQKVPAEDFILGSWADSPAGQPHSFRYPRTIEAYSRLGTEAPVRFLKATVDGIQLNTGIEAALFRPPLGDGR
ncbi:MAG: hypothetical protein O2894_03780 [Planctomycetota bacterium]|nr:hypothetical protein [Planctomycetota bacterium]